MVTKIAGGLKNSPTNLTGTQTPEILYINLKKIIILDKSEDSSYTTIPFLSTCISRNNQI